MSETKIPKADQEAIENAFSKDRKDSAISKGKGGKIIEVKKGIYDSRGFILRNYHGRVLKHNKSFISTDGLQVMAGKKGQKYEDVPERLRDRVSWQDSDFV